METKSYNFEGLEYFWLYVPPVPNPTKQLRKYPSVWSAYPVWLAGWLAVLAVCHSVVQFYT